MVKQCRKCYCLNCSNRKPRKDMLCMCIPHNHSISCRVATEVKYINCNDYFYDWVQVLKYGESEWER